MNEVCRNGGGRAAIKYRRHRRSIDRIHTHHEIIIYKFTSRKLVLLCTFLCICQSMALMSTRLSLRVCNNLPDRQYNNNISPHHRVARRRPYQLYCSAIKQSSSSNDEDDFMETENDEEEDSKGNSSGKENDDDDISTDDYFEKYISDALNEKDSSESETKDDDDAPTSSYSLNDGDINSTLSQTQQMMEQQQKQIDMLMKLVQQQQQPQPQSKQATQPDRIQRGGEQSSSTSNNMAPLKAMLFVDGTWLYYSLNSRNSNRDPIVPKFGHGWQNNYKVDWQALPRLICDQIEKQRDSQTSFSSGSDPRPLEISRVMVFTSAKKETDPNSIRMRMFRDMANANYDVHMMETVGQGEKCVDIQLAVEMLHYATVPNAYDVAILLR